MRRVIRAASIWAAGILMAAVPATGSEPAQGSGPGDAAQSPAVINAWVVDIPSPATITKVTGPVAILNKEEKRYDLAREGGRVELDDIVRMTEGASLEVTYADGTTGAFSYSDFPAAPDGAGTWVVFKEASGGAGQ